MLPAKNVLSVRSMLQGELGSMLTHREGVPKEDCVWERNGILSLSLFYAIKVLLAPRSWRAASQFLEFLCLNVYPLSPPTGP